MGRETRVLVTGGCGFAGHHLVEHFLKNTEWEIVVLDSLNYASSGLDRLRDIAAFDGGRVRTLEGVNITQIGNPVLAGEIGRIDYIVHMAAETHVDNSIRDPLPFIEANVMGTAKVLEYARHFCPSLKKLLYFSTDEVFGPAPEGVDYKEWDRYNSTNPYSATKAGGEELCLAWANTYGVPVFITHTMNIFGERQHPEKFIPLCIRKIMDGEEIAIHASKDLTKAGSRHWIHGRNVADAVQFLLEAGETREKYNIVGEVELDNLELAQKIAEVIGKPLNYKLTDFHSSRPGHDLRYSLDGSRMAGMGWSPPKGFDESLRRTVEWTLCNQRWL